MAGREQDESKTPGTTGHSWDGLEELNNPLPRWWLWTFYITVIWSVVYWIFMPAWPGLTDYTKGTRNHSERANVAAQLTELDAARGDSLKRLLTVQSIGEIEEDPDLRAFAIAAGDSIFGDNCATCHGAGGQGFVGYPNLNDDSWVWGGTLDDIQRTIRYGVRSSHPQTHAGVMQAFGRDKILTGAQIGDLVDFVTHLSGGNADPAAVERAAPLYAQTCASCHGEKGEGDRRVGAPNLADAISLYGNDRRSLRETITNGRAGMMPAWEGRLTEEQIAALAVYVHTLGGGE